MASTHETNGLIATIVGMVCIADIIAIWVMYRQKLKQDKEIEREKNQYK